MLLPIDGELRWHHVRLCSLWSDDSVPAYIGAAGQADPVEQFFDYHHDLYHDVLTNAYNRRFFEKQLRKLVEVDAIAMLDLDQFKQINDSTAISRRRRAAHSGECGNGLRAQPQRCTGAVRRRMSFC